MDFRPAFLVNGTAVNKEVKLINLILEKYTQNTTTGVSVDSIYVYVVPTGSNN